MITYEDYSDTLYKIINDDGSINYCCKGCGKEFLKPYNASNHCRFCKKLIGEEEYHKRKEITVTKRNNYNLTHYGCENVFQNKEIKEKCKKTKKQKYNDEFYNNTKKHKITLQNKSKEDWNQIEEKRRKTKLEKYGDETYNNTEKRQKTVIEKQKENPNYYQEIKEKACQTKIKKYNDPNYNNREKAKQTFLNKSNGQFYASMQFPETKNKLRENCLNKSEGKYAWPTQFPKTKETYKNNCLKKSNGRFTNSFQFPEVIIKCENTKYEKYNDKHFINNKKAINTCMENNSVPYGFMLGKKGIQRKNYKGEIYNSNWEIDFAKLCEKENIPFIRNYKNMESFIYKDIKGKLHTYYPDFYLPNKLLYIEIKPLHGNPKYDYWNNKQEIDIKIESVKKRGYKIMLVMEDLLYKNPDILLKLIK